MNFEMIDSGQFEKIHKKLPEKTLAKHNIENLG